MNSVVFQISGRTPITGDPMRPKWAAGFTDTQYESIREFLEKEGNKPIAEAQTFCFDLEAVKAMSRLQRDAAAGNWGDDKFDAELKKLGKMFGADGIEDPAATMAQKFYQREILNGAANGALQAGRTTEEHRAIFTYMRYLAGENPRPNHAALDGFVWRSGHPIENVVIPPNGWACNCRVLPISAKDAEARGWTGDFPAGTAALSEFLAMGGADAGFPKGSFVDGLPNSIAGC